MRGEANCPPGVGTDILVLTTSSAHKIIPSRPVNAFASAITESKIGIREGTCTLKGIPYRLRGVGLEIPCFLSREMEVDWI